MPDNTCRKSKKNACKVGKKSGAGEFAGRPVLPMEHEDKINALMAQMSLAEKADQLGSYYFGSNIYSNANLRLGIPNLNAGECLNGFMGNGATRFPQAIAMASTWEPALIERMGTVVARESRAFGVHQCYSPMLSVVRDIRWGRIEESYGECPFLVAAIGVAYVKGLQGMGPERFGKERILACVKHYVADGEPMAGDNGAAMDVSDYNLHNVHHYPFRQVFAEAGAASVMPAHHILNGEPCHASNYVMHEILRQHYGYAVSDNQDLDRLLKLFHFAADKVDTAAKALAAGVHQELDLRTQNLARIYDRETIITGVQSGRIPEALVDAAVAMNLRAKFALGLFESEPPTPDLFLENADGPPLLYADHFGIYRGVDKEKFQAVADRVEKRINRTVVNDPRHDALALEVARKAVILLKNKDRILPLNLNRLRRIAVIGPNANALRLGGYSRGKQKYFVTILDGIRKFVGDRAVVEYAEGAAIDTAAPSSHDAVFNLELTRQAEPGAGDAGVPDTEKIRAAVALAAGADVAVLAIGGSEDTTRENEDADYLGLRGRQLELVQAVHATGTPCVVVFLGGRPDPSVWIEENIPGIIQGWYLGQDTGTVIAETIFGKLNPGGKMPVTVPRNVGQVPLFYNKLETGRPRRIYRSNHQPLYAFGHGLSYTTFSLTNLRLDKESIAPDEQAKLSVDLTNTGAMAGDEVVQLYIRAWDARKLRPLKELRGFKRVHLQPGETVTVEFAVGRKELEYWNGTWLVEPGRYSLFVATDSTDEKLKLNQVDIRVAESASRGRV